MDDFFEDSLFFDDDSNTKQPSWLRRIFWHIVKTIAMAMAGAYIHKIKKEEELKNNYKKVVKKHWFGGTTTEYHQK